MERGFSTLELLIAMTVLTLAIVATLLLMPGAGLADGSVSGAALEEADMLLAHAAASARTDPKLVMATSSIVTIDGTTYTEVLTVEASDFATRRATATVSWNGLYGRPSSVSASMLFADYGRLDTTCGVRSGVWNFPIAHSYLFGTLPGLYDTSGAYTLTDIDVLNGNLFATVNESISPLPSEGPRSAGAIANDTSVGNVIWNAPGNASVSNGSYATASLSSGDRSEYLLASNFGFSIPNGATILGIEVDVERKASSNTNTVRDNDVRIVHSNGSFGSVNKAHATNWPTSEAYATYGASSDLWNETDWSASVIDDPNFGVVFSAMAFAGANPRTASVDDIRITVTYTRQFYVVSVTGSPTVVTGLGENAISTGMNALMVASSTSTGTHAYVATNSGATQFETIDLEGAPRVVSSLHVPGSAVADAITYRDGYVYLGLAGNSGGPEFEIIDVHDPTAPLPVASYEVGAGVNAIRVVHDRAYLATDDSSRELIILDVSDLAHPLLIGTYDAPGSIGSGGGRALDMIGDILFLGRYYSLTAAPEFSILDASASSSLPLGTYDIGPSSAQPFGVYGLDARDGFAAVLTSSHAGGSVVMLDISDSAHAKPISTTGLPNGGGGVALDCESNRLYAASVPQSGAYKDRGSLTLIDSL